MAYQSIRIFFGLVAMLAAVAGDGRDLQAGNAFDPLGSVQKAFGKDLEVSVKADRYRIAYCPDNTCDIIEMPKTVGKAVMADFVYLHTVFLNGYNYDVVANFREAQKPQHVRAVLDRNAGACGRNGKFARCVIETMMQQHNIVLAFSRADEGADREAALKPAHLKVILDRVETYNWVVDPVKK